MRGEHKKLRVILVLIAAICGLFLLHPSPTSASINPQINFQGKLTNPDGTNVTDGTYSIVFSIYSVSSGGSAIWTETQGSVNVSSGIFQVNLGSVTTLPGSVNFNSNSLYLGVKVGSDAEMTPRVQFTAVPYAFNSDALGGVLASGYGTLAGTQTWAGGNTFSTVLAANGGLNISGLETQTYGSGTSATARTQTVTNTNVSSTPSTVNGVSIALIGTANATASANTLNAINFVNVTPANNNSFNGLNFGTGYTSILSYSGTPIINGVGVLQSAGLSGTYSNALTFSNASNSYTGNSLTIGGNASITGTLTGLTGLTVASGGASITGNSTITGTLSGLTGLTVASGGASITGNSTIAGTLSGLTGLTVASGGASISGGLNNNNGNITNVASLSIGTSSAAAYDIDIRNSASSALHFSPDATDTGAYLTPFLNNGFFLSGGAAFNGTAWVAKAPTASIMDTVNGQYLFFSNSSLTAGSTYTPTQRFEIDGSGNLLATGALSGLTGLTVASGGAAITGVSSVTGGNLTVQQTGTGAAVIINRTDGVISSLKSGLAKSSFVFDSSGTFGIAFDTRTNIASGTGAGTDAITILGSGNVGVSNTNPVATFSVGSGDLFQIAGATGNAITSGTFLQKSTSTTAFQIQTTGGGSTLFLADTSAMKITITGAAQVTGHLQVGSLQVGSSATAGDILFTDASGNLTFAHPDFKAVYNTTTLTSGNNIVWTGSTTTTAAAIGATICLTTNGICTGTAIFPNNIFSIQVTAQGGTNAGNTPRATINSLSADRRTLTVNTTNSAGALNASQYVAATVYVEVVGN